MYVHGTYTIHTYSKVIVTSEGPQDWNRDVENTQPGVACCSKTLCKKTVQDNIDDDRLNKQYFSRAHTVERRE